MVECDRCHKRFGTYAALKQHFVNQHSNAKWPDAFETKLIEEKGLQTYKANLRPTQGSRTKLIIAVLLIVIVAGAAWIYLPSVFQTPANPQCASFPFSPIGDQALAVHDHALLLIYVNGQQVKIPVNVGEGDSGPCTQPLHVHATAPDTDVIHIESPVARTYTLGDFFKVWAATPNMSGPTTVVFDQNHIFNYAAGNGYELRMYVSGQQSTAFDSLVLQPHQVIVIVYGNSATNWSYYQNLSAQQWPFPDY
jgi:hypothetical protein